MVWSMLSRSCSSARVGPRLTRVGWRFAFLWRFAYLRLLSPPSSGHPDPGPCILGHRGSGARLLSWDFLGRSINFLAFLSFPLRASCPLAHGHLLISNYGNQRNASGQKFWPQMPGPFLLLLPEARYLEHGPTKYVAWVWQGLLVQCMHWSVRLPCCHVRGV